MCRYAGGVVPTVAKLTTQPIGLVKALPGAAVKSLYSQHDEYYVRNLRHARTHAITRARTFAALFTMPAVSPHCRIFIHGTLSNTV